MSNADGLPGLKQAGFSGALRLWCGQAITDTMTGSELQDLLVGKLARSAGGTQRRWRIVLGPVRVHDVATHPHCNWSVNPSGGAREVSDVERLLDRIRLDHPIVTGE